ncbi:MAG: N-acetylmuramoyl-L-alanine amidase [Nitrospirae bacterium]|uniref:N-acetylmuramoyl-L-alanine amidase n=1 Tax=Candidatus Magnetobacterium casense TaxID=1455061 RepID=UPI000698ED06|nr:N-acetylmuramoyl-L-alanine amidase [Candidatus Magnetobacterium casensis]MBF0336514.1 N-acetylmuramoyl-L-alanine amidase [Nitrospirota bacterium]
MDMKLDKATGLVTPCFKGKSSPNVYANRLRGHLEYIIIHYTVGLGFRGVVDFFMTPRQTSAHFVVDRDGTIEQLVSLNDAAWHAGISYWGGHNGLNSYSAGIEIINAGYVKKTDDGSYRSELNQPVAAEDVSEATHKHEHTKRLWMSYSDAQTEAVLDLCHLIKQNYPSVKDILGHDDIAPGRKFDPGPLFPLTELRLKLFG